jgi:hypothetical protein
MTSNPSVLFGECFASISTARSPACCAKLFLDVLRPYQVEIFACGEIDLTDNERTVFARQPNQRKCRRFAFTRK